MDEIGRDGFKLGGVRHLREMHDDLGSSRPAMPLEPGLDFWRIKVGWGGSVQ